MKTYHGLNPVYCTRSYPHKVTRFLYKSIYWYILFIEIFQYRPPGTSQIVDTIPVKWSIYIVNWCFSKYSFSNFLSLKHVKDPLAALYLICFYLTVKDPLAALYLICFNLTVKQLQTNIILQHEYEFQSQLCMSLHFVLY